MSDASTKFPCSNCGADLEYLPGSDTLICPYCQTENRIDTPESVEIREQDYEQALEQLRTAEDSAGTVDKLVTRCDTCGAEVAFGENQTAGECPFCGSNIVAQNQSVKAIKPASLLPFRVSREDAAVNFRTWLKKRWFAPNKLKHYARVEGLKGIYSPFWTYDASTSTDYRGQRGEYYWVNESYTTTEDGKTVTKTRQVRKIRWHSCSGNVCRHFDDVLVHASSNIEEKYVDRLEPWDLVNLVPYNDSYLSGFLVESYTRGVEKGLDVAKSKMAPEIVELIKRDIGGDEQRISSRHTDYSAISFKHLLLPVWMGAYKYKNKVYQMMVNARTGEVQGTRPWSILKIAFAVLGAAAIITLGVLLFLEYGN